MDKRQKDKRDYEIADVTNRLQNHVTGGGGSAVTLPKGVYAFTPKQEGEYTLDILAFKTTNRLKRCIAKQTRFCEPGELYYEQTFFQHWGVGPSQKPTLCSAFTFRNGKCSVCEFRQKSFRDPDRDADLEKLTKDLREKERQLFLVWDHANKAKGIGLWDISIHLFGENLDIAMKATKEPKKAEARRMFFHPTKGMTLTLVGKEKSMGNSKPFLEFPSVQFEAREKPVPKEVIEKALAIDLTECLRESDYKELKATFTTGLSGKKDDEEEENADTPDEETDDDEEGEGGEGDEDEEEDDAEDDEGGVEGDDDVEEDGDEDDVAAAAAGPAFKKGQPVKFEYKGKTRTGTVVGVKKDEDGDVEFYKIEHEDREVPFNVPPDDVFPAKKTKKKPEPEDDEDEDTPPPKKKDKAKPKKKPPADEEEEDEFEKEFGDVEDDDEEEEEEKPRKKKVKVKAGAKKPKKKSEDDDDDTFGDDF